MVWRLYRKSENKGIKVLLYIYKESAIIEKWIYDEKYGNQKGKKMGNLHNRTIEFDDMDQMTSCIWPI